MDRFDIRRVAMGLTAYSIERQGGWERQRPEGAPTWQEQRRFWTDAILQGMAKLDGLMPDPKLMEQYDLELKQAQDRYFFTPATRQTQKDTIRELRRFVAALEATGDDRRRQVSVVRDLLEDMSLHRNWWNGKSNGLDQAYSEADRALIRMTAQMPIRFTRIVLGEEAGLHWASGFVSGSVTDEEAVRQTAVYQDAVRKYPEIPNWPALCTVYVGRDLPCALGTVDASDFDLEIMNRTGDRFLNEQGINWAGGSCQMTIAATPELTASAEMQTEKQTEEQSSRLQGSRPLEPDDFTVYEYSSSGDGYLTFRLELMTDEKTAFGRQLSSEQENSCIMIYATYDETKSQVHNTLDVELQFPCYKTWFYCELSPAIKDALKQKIDDFCVESYGEHLSELSAKNWDGPSMLQMGSALTETGPSMSPAMG